MKTELEVCVVDAAGVAAAVASGADRLELCAALEIGGITPTRGFVTHREFAVPTRVLIRPRGGNFVYSSVEVDMMLKDIAELRDTAVDGFVIGALTAEHELDEAVLGRLVDACDGYEVSLHRAFDHASNQELALEQAIDLGFDRILSSGGRASAVEGLERLASIKEKAGDRIRVIPGGGISVDNVETILASLQPTEVHASCSSSLREDSDANVKLGATGNGIASATDPVSVRRLAHAVHRYS